MGTRAEAPMRSLGRVLHQDIRKGGSVRHLLVVNCGSATVETKQFREHENRLTEVAAVTDEVEAGYRIAVARALAALRARPDAIANRVVHGGDKLAEAVIVNAATLRELRDAGGFVSDSAGPASRSIPSGTRRAASASRPTTPAWRPTSSPPTRSGSSRARRPGFWVGPD